MTPINSSEILETPPALDGLVPPPCLVDSFGEAVLRLSSTPYSSLAAPQGRDAAAEVAYLSQFLPALPDGRAFELVFSRSQLLHAFAEGRAQIEALNRKALQETAQPLVVVGLLEGARPTMEAVTAGLESGLRIEYMKLSSYDEHNQYLGRVVLRSAPLDVRGRRVVLVDDILDRGHSMLKAWELLQSWEADLSNSASMALMDRSGVPKEITADYVLMDYDRGDGLWVAGAGPDYSMGPGHEGLYRWRDHVIGGPPQK